MHEAKLSPGSHAYRPDIDGLRAIAVLSVVAYHLDKSWLPGGFVGVDIFFVISGYLITRIIWSDLLQGRFSLAEFYLRRIRRIAPAFFVMAAATLVAGTFLLLPEDLARLSRSAAWASLSAANVYFWRYLDTGYFADSADEEPMLHTWSLGVEEQFYLLWPGLLMLVALFPKRKPAVAALTGLVCVGSFAYGQAIVSDDPKFAYFMLPARAGELMLGALLALAPLQPGKMGTAWRAAAELLALSGFALLGVSLFALDDSSPFPGWNALYPCLGAALLMLAGRHSTLVRWTLANPPMVAVGLVSYSLYLWHWPILAFARYFLGQLTPVHAGIAFVAMLVLAGLSYRFVEQPARRMRARRFVQVAALLGAPAVAVIAFGGAMHATGGLKRWIESGPGVARMQADTAPAYQFDYVCQLNEHDPTILEQPRCVVGARSNDTAPRTLLWGDSHASHYAGVIGAMAKADGISFRIATHAACPPVFHGDYGIAPYREGCGRFRPYVAASLARGDFDVVFMGANWSVYDAAPGFRSDFRKTLQAITARGTRVVLLAEAPRFARYNRECDLRWSRLDRAGCEQLATADKESRVNRFLRDLAQRDRNVSLLDVRSAICASGWCRPYLDGHPVYFDAAHLSLNGSWRIGEAMAGTGAGRQWIAALRGQHVVADNRAAATTGQNGAHATNAVAIP